ncbi:MAG: helix-turn-helix transcriptional regulator [Opitutaceae bacterium]|nr:helix-turn-helix transcriptional regulator [Opitutaceae bacterium]
MVSTFLPASAQRVVARPMSDLQSALDLESFWRANLQLLQSVLPHHSCSLMLGIVDFEPQEGRHFVARDKGGANQPLTSLSISRPFLAAHPQVKMYTYTEILREDPRARQRRVERERHFRGWDEFVHLAFWDGSHPEAVLSIRRSEEQGEFLAEEREFLASLHPVIDAGLRRLRAFEGERGRRLSMERFISGLPLPVLFLGPDRALQFATQEAYDLCAVWNYGYKEARVMNTRRCFRVPEPIDDACARLADIWDRAASDGLAVGLESARVTHREIGGLVAKVDVSQPYKGSLVRPGFWVTLFGERNLDGADSELKAEAIHQLQFLTPSERRVALLVVEGLRNQDVARRLGKSPRTVDFQLNAIYRKLGVRGRTELARMLR